MPAFPLTWIRCTQSRTTRGLSSTARPFSPVPSTPLRPPKAETRKTSSSYAINRSPPNTSPIGKPIFSILICGEEQSLLRSREMPWLRMSILRGRPRKTKRIRRLQKRLSSLLSLNLSRLRFRSAKPCSQPGRTCRLSPTMGNKSVFVTWTANIRSQQPRPTSSSERKTLISTDQFENDQNQNNHEQHVNQVSGLRDSRDARRSEISEQPEDQQNNDE